MHQNAWHLIFFFLWEFSQWNIAASVSGLRVFFCNMLSINQICITKLSASPLGCPGAGPFAYRTVRRSQESLQTPVTAEPAVHIALEMKLEWQKNGCASLQGWNMHLCFKGYVEITRQHSSARVCTILQESKCRCVYFVSLPPTTILHIYLFLYMSVDTYVYPKIFVFSFVYRTFTYSSILRYGGGKEWGCVLTRQFLTINSPGGQNINK